MNLSNMIQLNRFETYYHSDMDGKEFIEDTLSRVREAFVEEDGYRVIRITEAGTGHKKIMSFGHTLQAIHIDALGRWISDRVGNGPAPVKFLLEMFISSADPENLL